MSGRVAVLAGLVALLLALPAEGAPGPVVKVKNTNGWIESMTMSGALVAYDVGNRYTDAPCNKLFVWNVQTGGGAVVGGKQTCGADSTSTGAGVREIAVAGSRVAWIVNLGGNTESSDYLYTATLPKPKEKLLASVTRNGDVDGTLTGGWIGGLVGDGSRIAVSAWRTGKTGEVIRAALRAVSGRLSTIANGVLTYRAAAADAGRIAVSRRNGSVALYSSAGTVVRTIEPASVNEVALQGPDLLVLTGAKTIEAYSAATGALLHTWPVAGGAGHLDVHAGVAVYAAGRKVHELRLADGKDVVLASAPREVVELQIEEAGVVFAYDTVKGIRDIGNLAYVPLARATAALG